MRRSRLLLLTLALPLALFICGAKPSAPPERPADPVEDALEQYRAIVGQADTYQYDPDAAPSGNYRYALVQMQPEDTVPTLLLEQETTDCLYHSIVFRCDPETGAVTQQTGATHELNSPYDIVEQHENLADKWAIKKLVPKDELDKAVKAGHTEIWDLAELFNVTEPFMRKAAWWYTYGNMAVDSA